MSEHNTCVVQRNRA